MTGIDSYSTTPATNATADGGAINWAEGQPPSSVNNTARQMLADTRGAFNDLVWFDYGTGDQGAGNIAVPSVYLSSTSFTITGADVTLVYESGRRVRAIGSSTGTIYGSISTSSYNSGNTKTTVTVLWDSGSLSNETLVICLSQIPVTGAPVSPGSIVQSNRYTNFGTFSPANYNTTSATAVMTGMGGIWKITPSSTGNIRVRATATITAIASSLPSNAILTINYGTGTAPAQGDPSAGTPGNSVASSFAAQITASNSQSSVPVEFEIVGMPLGTALWFDGALSSSNGATTVFVTWQGIIIEEF